MDQRERLIEVAKIALEDRMRCLPGTREFAVAAVDAILAATGGLPPSDEDPWLSNGDYVVDRFGMVWTVVRDGGMVSGIDPAQENIVSAGMEWLKSTRGPVRKLNIEKGTS